MARLTAVLLAARCFRGFASHACEQEISAACPDSPAEDVAACLTDESMHEQPTELSSDCTDFIAVNNACKDDIEQFCDCGPFADDTVLCLTKWTQNDDLSAKCRKVLKWAAPQGEEEEDGAVDELGRSEKDRKELKEWHAKRREQREEAIALTKQKEEDAKKEADRRAREEELEKLKKDDPEEYKRQKKEIEKQKEREAAKRKAERKKKAEEDAKLREERATERAKKKLKKMQDERPPYLQYALVLCGAGFVIANVVNLFGGKDSKSKKDKKKKKEKKEKDSDSSDDKED